MSEVRQRCICPACGAAHTKRSTTQREQAKAERKRARRDERIIAIYRRTDWDSIRIAANMGIGPSLARRVLHRFLGEHPEERRPSVARFKKGMSELTPADRARLPVGAVVAIVWDDGTVFDGNAEVVGHTAKKVTVRTHESYPRGERMNVLPRNLRLQT